MIVCLRFKARFGGVPIARVSARELLLQQQHGSMRLWGRCLLQWRAHLYRGVCFVGYSYQLHRVHEQYEHEQRREGVG